MKNKIISSLLAAMTVSTPLVGATDPKNGGKQPDESNTSIIQISTSLLSAQGNNGQERQITDPQDIRQTMKTIKLTLKQLKKEIEENMSKISLASALGRTHSERIQKIEECLSNVEVAQRSLDNLLQYLRTSKNTMRTCKQGIDTITTVEPTTSLLSLHNDLLEEIRSASEFCKYKEKYLEELKKECEYEREREKFVGSHDSARYKSEELDLISEIFSCIGCIRSYARVPDNCQIRNFGEILKFFKYRMGCLKKNIDELKDPSYKDYKLWKWDESNKEIEKVEKMIGKEIRRATEEEKIEDDCMSTDMMQFLGYISCFKNCLEGFLDVINSHDKDDIARWLICKEAFDFVHNFELDRLRDMLDIFKEDIGNLEDPEYKGKLQELWNRCNEDFEEGIKVMSKAVEACVLTANEQNMVPDFHRLTCC